MALQSLLDHDLDTSHAASDSATPHVDVIGSQGETVRRIPLDRHVVTIGRASINNVVLEGEGIGRMHLRLTRDTDQIQIIDLGCKSGTLLENKPMVANTAHTWLPDTMVRIGPYRLRLNNVASFTRVLVETPSTLVREEPSTLALQLEGGRETLELTPGQNMLVVLLLINSGLSEERRTLSVEGIPTSWLALPERVLIVPANGRISVSIRITVPRSSEAKAGEYDVKLSAHSVANTALVSMINAFWTVQPFTAASLTIRPRKQAVRGMRTASYSLLVQNMGNTSINAVLHASEEEPTLDVYLEQSHLLLEPGATVRVRLDAQTQEEPINKQQTYSFTTQLTYGDARPVIEMGYLTQTASVARWILPVAIAVLVVLLLAVVWWQSMQYRGGVPVAPNRGTPTSFAGPSSSV